MSTFLLSLETKSEEEKEITKQYHTFYIWVPFIIFLQGLSFYLPNVIWKAYDKGHFKVRMLK